MERLVDLDELILRCRTEQTKVYVTEAVACYQAGAYRASIVSTWIAVVLDIVEKLRELSLMGDGQARALLGSFERYQESVHRGDETSIRPALEFERTLLERAQNELQLLDAQQFLDLSRLREDRHRCAHPTFQRMGAPYVPSAELARTHLRNAIFHLLQHPPVQGKAALKQLRQIVSSRYFPTDIGEARINLENELGRPTNALVQGFVDTLIFGLFERDDALRMKLRTAVALSAIIEMHRGVAAPRLIQQITKLAARVSDDDFKGIILVLGTANDIWGSLDEPTRIKTRQFLGEAPFEQLLPVIKYAENIEGLGETLAARIEQFSIDELTQAIGKSAHRLYVSRAVEIFSTAGSWNQANEIAEKVVLPLVPYMTVEAVEEVIGSPKDRGSDLVGSGGFNRFLKEVLDAGLLSRNRLNELVAELQLNLEFILQEPLE